MNKHSYIDKQIMFDPKDSKQVKALQSLGYVCNMMKGIAMNDGAAGYLDSEMAIFEYDIKDFIKDSSIDPKKVIASFEFNSYDETYGYRIFVNQGEFAFEQTEVKWVRCGMLYPFDPFENGGSDET